MNRQFDLSWTTKRPTLCPSCLEELTDASIVFCENLAFCPLCALPDNDRVRDHCLRIFHAALSPDQWATYRRLNFFTPSRHPRKPLQLVRRDGVDSWLLDPDSEDLPSVVDDNPLAGGSPI